MPIPSTPTHLHISASTHPPTHTQSLLPNPEMMFMQFLLKESPSLHSHSYHPTWGTHHFSPTLLQCHANLCSCQTFRPPIHPSPHYYWIYHSTKGALMISFICLETISAPHCYQINLPKENSSYYSSIQKMAVPPSCPVNWIQIAKGGIQCPLQYGPYLLFWP